jgi:lipoate-protein ligase A
VDYESAKLLLKTKGLKKENQMKIKIYLSAHQNPWFNLATEDYLFKNSPEDTQVLFLWQNAPSIIIGRAQNPYLECQLAQMEQDGVILARRQSGGGTVYHDLGNLNFTFISPASDYSKDKNFNIILNALTALNIHAIRSGRNDLLISHQGEDRKISGSAFRETKKIAFHHGTLLVHADLQRLTRYLSPSQKKLEAKGVPSVRSRVMNLIEISPEISIQKIQNEIIQAFAQQYSQETSPQDLNLQSLESIPSLKACYETYASWDWRYGRTLPFTHKLEERFSWGLVTLLLMIENAVIQDCECYTDSLDAIDFDPLKKALIQTRYDAKEIAHALENQPDYPKEFKQWLISEIQ